ncbi:MAG: hypothetical protein KDI12_20615 [Anaerolineae bacterium]|nr:hypothetical protein [Planctomycetaceae bacterium]MCB0245828.1 hypothetical protein [Anaerolineae bacterium]
MKRRHFIHAAASLAAVSASGLANATGSVVRSLTSKDGFRAGDRYRLADGRMLVIDDVVEIRESHGFRQFGVRFLAVDGGLEQEGLQQLHGPTGNAELFLQPQPGGAVAWFSQAV